jgi:hypothetical protein
VESIDHLELAIKELPGASEIYEQTDMPEAANA